jgi:hypothetical protein
VSLSHSLVLSQSLSCGAGPGASGRNRRVRAAAQGLASTCPALPPRCRRRSKGTESKGSWSAAFSGSPAPGRSRLLLLVPLTTYSTWLRFSRPRSEALSFFFLLLCCCSLLILSQFCRPVLRAPRGLLSLSLLSLRVTQLRSAPHFRGRFCCCVFPAFVLCFPSAVTVREF